MPTINIELPKKEQERLRQLALRFGLSLPELSRRVLRELCAEIPEETFADYRHPRVLKSSLRRAIHEWESGHFSRAL